MMFIYVHFVYDDTFTAFNINKLSIIVNVTDN